MKVPYDTPGNRNTRGDAPKVVSLSDHRREKETHKPLAVLLAEQEPMDNRWIGSILQRVGHKVFSVDCGARLLDALDNRQFDIAIVSVILPKLSGLEVFKLYRLSRTLKKRRLEKDAMVIPLPEINFEFDNN